MDDMQDTAQDAEPLLPAAARPSWHHMLAHLNGESGVPPELSPKAGSHRRKVTFEVLEDRDD